MLEEMIELQQEASLGVTAFITISLTGFRKVQMLMSILSTQIYFKKKRLKLGDIILFPLKY